MEVLDKRTWTYDDYLKLDDDKRYEIIKGRLVETAGASFEHQDVLTIILMKMREFCDRNNLGKVIPSPFDVVLNDENVVFISNEKLHLIKNSLFGVPDYVIENNRYSLYCSSRIKEKIRSKVLEGFEIDLKEVFE